MRNGEHWPANRLPAAEWFWLLLALAVAGMLASGAFGADVRDFGAVPGDDIDDSAAFQAAIDAAVDESPARVLVPADPRGGEYLVLAPIRLRSGVTLISPTVPALIRNDATSRDVGNKAFLIDGAADVTLDNLIVRSTTTPCVAVSMRGLVSGVRLSRLQLFGGGNFAIEYADTGTDPELSRLRDLRVSDCTICGAAKRGDGSGLISFSRPPGSATGIVIERCLFDVTGASSNRVDHGPQAIKLQCCNGVVIRDCRVFGGSVAGIVITNGARNVRIERVAVESANRGWHIDSTQHPQAPGGFTDRVSLIDCRYLSGDIQGGQRIALFTRDVSGLSLTDFDRGDGRIVGGESADIIEQPSAIQLVDGMPEALPMVFGADGSWPVRPVPGRAVDVQILDVYDGDTLTVRVSNSMRVRLLDCWAPEIRTKDAEEKRRGLAARDFLARLAANQSGTVWIPTHERIGDETSLGRFLGHVWIDGDELSLSQRMVDAGHATRFKVQP